MKFTHKKAQFVRNLQQTCTNAVPASCYHDVFALPAPSLLTICQWLVGSLLQQSCCKQWTRYLITGMITFSHSIGEKMKHPYQSFTQIGHLFQSLERQFHVDWTLVSFPLCQRSCLIWQTIVNNDEYIDRYNDECLIRNFFVGFNYWSRLTFQISRFQVHWLQVIPVTCYHPAIQQLVKKLWVTAWSNLRNDNIVTRCWQACKKAETSYEILTQVRQWSGKVCDYIRRVNYPFPHKKVFAHLQ